MKLERLQTLESENEDLQCINGELLGELEKRDQAVQEAVGMICDLEAKVERLELALIDTRPSTALPDTEISTSDNEPVEPRSSPPTLPNIKPQTPGPSEQLQTDHLNPRLNLEPSQFFDKLSPSRSKSPWRTPSFLREKTESVSALRSLYSIDEDGMNAFSYASLPRPTSVLSRDDESIDPDRQNMRSPALSVLSESSLVSVYGKQKNSRVSMPKPDEEDVSKYHADPKQHGSPPKETDQRTARIHKWMDDRDSPSRKSRSHRRGEQVSSIDEVLEKSPISFDRQASRHVSGQRLADHPPVRENESRDKPIFPLSLSGPVYNQQVFPPTPDTMLTASAVTAKSSASSIVAEKSLLDGTPAPAKGYSSLTPRMQPDISTGPTSDITKPVSFDDDGQLESPEEDVVSTKVERSDFADERGFNPFSSPSALMSGSQRTMRSLLPESPIRPPLMTHVNNMMFNGEGYDLATPSRATSYPSPTANPRRHSLQVSPSYHQPLFSSRTGVEPLSPQDWLSASSATATPTRSSKPSRNVPDNTPRPLPKDQVSNENSGVRKFDSSVPPKIPAPKARSPTQTSMTSRLFRRGNSNTAQPPAESQRLSPSKQLPSSLSFSQRQRHTGPSKASSTSMPNKISPRESRIAQRTSSSSAEHRQKVASFGEQRQLGGFDGNVDTGANAPGMEKDGANNGTASMAASEHDRYHQRTASQKSESDVPPAGQGSKWGIGRSASARIKQGLGRMKGEK